MTSKNLWVRKPAMRDGAWVVIIADGVSPLSNEVEVIPCGSREAAYKAYKTCMKNLGRSF